MTGLNSPNILAYQYIALPIVMVLLWRLRLLKRRAPISVLVGAVTIGLLCSFAPGWLPASDRSAQIATFEGDPLGARAALLSRRVERAFTRIGTDLELGTQITQVFEGAEQVRLVLNSGARQQIIVWGNSGWLNLSFRDLPTKALSEFPILSMYRGAEELRLVQSVPVIGLSFEPPQASAMFISELIAAHSVARPEEFWISASLTQAAWTSFAHRAYPTWQLANLQLAQSLEGEFEPALLKCAMENYDKALTFLRRGDNIELESAIYNNLAMAHMVDFFINGVADERKVAYELLEFAQAAGKQPNMFKIILDAPLESRLNAATLRAFYQPRRKKHKKPQDVN